MWKYWKTVLKRALLESWSDLSLGNWRQIVTKVVVGIIAVIFMWWWGWYEIAKDRLGEIWAILAAIGLVGVVVFLCHLLRAPYLLASEYVEEIERLNGLLSENDVVQKRNKLQKIWHKLGVISETELPEKTSENSEEMDLLEKQLNEYLTESSAWIRKHFGDAADARFLSEDNWQSLVFPGAANPRHNKLLSRIRSLRGNIEYLISNDKWYS